MCQGDAQQLRYICPQSLHRKNIQQGSFLTFWQSVNRPGFNLFYCDNGTIIGLVNFKSYILQSQTLNLNFCTLYLKLECLAIWWGVEWGIEPNDMSACKGAFGNLSI